MPPRAVSLALAVSGELGERMTGSVTGIPSSHGSVATCRAGGSGLTTTSGTIETIFFATDLGRPTGRPDDAFDLMTSALAAAISSKMAGLDVFLGEETSSFVLFAASGFLVAVDEFVFWPASFLVVASSFKVLFPTLSRIDCLPAIGREACFWFSSLIIWGFEVDMSSLAASFRFDPVLVGCGGMASKGGGWFGFSSLFFCGEGDR